MQVPNLLFYDNCIKCGYVGDEEKIFLYSRSPFLFVDVPNGSERVKSTSFFNLQEVEATVLMANLCIQSFRESNTHHANENGCLPLQRFTRSSLCVITPYNAQKNAIAERFAVGGMEDQVISIDSSQGREFDIVLVSMVRTKPGNFIKEYNRINVGITRAKHGLIIIGSAKCLSRDPKWQHLLNRHQANIVNGVKGAR